MIGNEATTLKDFFLLKIINLTPALYSKMEIFFLAINSIQEFSPFSPYFSWHFYLFDEANFRRPSEGVQKTSVLLCLMPYIPQSIKDEKTNKSIPPTASGLPKHFEQKHF